MYFDLIGASISEITPDNTKGNSNEITLQEGCSQLRDLGSLENAKEIGGNENAQVNNWIRPSQFEKSHPVHSPIPLLAALDEKKIQELGLDSDELKHWENIRFSVRHAALSVYSRNPDTSNKASHNKHQHGGLSQKVLEFLHTQCIRHKDVSPFHCHEIQHQ